LEPICGDENLKYLHSPADAQYEHAFGMLALRAHLILYKVTAKASIFRGFIETAVTSEVVRHGL